MKYLLLAMLALSPVLAQPDELVEPPMTDYSFMGHLDPFSGSGPELARALADHGFAVMGQLSAPQPYHIYYDMYLAGRPVVVTSDAMLYLWYQAHRNIVTAVERDRLLPLTRRLVEALWSAHLRSPGGAPREELAALAVALRLAEALRLAGAETQLPPDLAAQAAPTLARIRAGKLVEPYPGDDYSQYVPRGPYVDSPELGQYFRLTKWLGRHLVPLAGGDASPASLRRASWWCALLRRDKAAAEAQRALADTRRWLAGAPNMVGPDELERCLTAVGANPESLSDADCQRLAAELSRPGYTRTAVRGRFVDPLAPLPTFCFALLPEQASPDARVLQAVMDQRGGDTAPAPGGLPVAAALGIERAKQLCGQPVAAVTPAADNLAEPWLALLPTLQETAPGAPRFMRSAPWQDKSLNTALTSWAQLRHNYLLYQAPAYEVYGVSLETPKCFVEPLPTFWRRYRELVDGFTAQLLRRGLRTADQVRWLQFLSREAAWAAEDTDRELRSQVPTHADHWHRWYQVLERGGGRDAAAIADVATLVDGVVYAGSGWMHPIVEQFELPGWAPIAAVGAVGSYYEFTEPGTARLTDAGWRDRLHSDYARPDPPDWALSYQLGLSPAEVEQRRVLRGAEADLLAGRAEPAIERLRAWQPSVAGSEAEVRAQVLIAQALDKLGRPEQARAARLACDRLYGCKRGDDAVAEALDQRALPDEEEGRFGVDSSAADAPWASSRDELDAWLAGTEPRPGLTAAEEAARQDSRVRALTARLTGDALAARLAKECPGSRLLPAGRLIAAAGPCLAHALDSGHANEPGQADTGALATIGQTWPESLVGELAACAAVASGDTAALDLLLRHAGGAPKRETCPESAQWLRERLGLSAESRPARLTLGVHADRLIESAAHAGRAAELLSLEQRLRGFTVRRFPLELWVARHEPEVFALWCRGDRYNDSQESIDQAKAALDQLVRQYPRSALAPLALTRRIDLDIRQPMVPFGPIPVLRDLDRGLLRQLADSYAGTRWGCLAAAALAALNAEFDRADQLRARAANLPQEPWQTKPSDEVDGARYWFEGLERTAASVRACQPLLPGWSAKRILDAIIDLTDRRHEPEAVAPLMKAAGDKAVALLRALPGDTGAEDWLAHAYPDQAPRQPSPMTPDEDWAKLVDAGPGPRYRQAVAALARARHADDAPLVPSSPSAALLRANRAELLLSQSWPDQAVALALPATTYASPFRERAAAVVATARSLITARGNARLREVWRTQPGGREQYLLHYESIALGAGTVYASGPLADGSPGVMAIDRADGALRWQAACGSGTMVQIGDCLYVASRNQLLALDAATGACLARDRLDSVGSFAPWATAAGPWLVCTAGDLILGRAPGQPGWRTEVPQRADVEVADDVVVVLAGDTFAKVQTLIGLDLATGRERWRQPVTATKEGRPSRHSVRGNHGTILLELDDDREVSSQVVDPATGALRPAPEAPATALWPLLSREDDSAPRRRNNLTEPADAPAWRVVGRDVYGIDPADGHLTALCRVPPGLDVVALDNHGLLATRKTGELVYLVLDGASR